MNSELVRHITRFPNIEWNFKKLSYHPNLTLSTLEHFHDKQWDFYNGVSRNKNWNWSWVRYYPNKNWNWSVFSESLYFRWEWVYELPNKSWDWCMLSDSATIDILERFQDKPWNWFKLTLSENIPVKDMIDHPYFPWKINDLLFTYIDDEEIRFLRFYRSHYDENAWIDHTIHTPWSIIKNNLDLPWNVKYITIIDTFEDSDVRYLYDLKGWNMDYMSEVLSIDIISKCSDLKWNYEIVSKKSNLNYKKLNTMTGLNMHVVNLDFERREWSAAETIKRYWKKCATDPAYTMCKRLVLFELTDALDKRNIS
jgi:hypothetical protein